MKYTKKPIEVEALQWDGTHAGLQKIKALFPGLTTDQLAMTKDGLSIMYWSIKTREGAHIVSKNDYIIKGVEGEIYPCKPSIFLKTYDPA